MEFVANVVDRRALRSTVKQRLDFLYSEAGKAAVKAAHNKGGKWWFNQDTEIDAPWDGAWLVGKWITRAS